MQALGTPAAYRGTAVEVVNERFAQNDGKQLGETAKGCERVYEAIFEEGMWRGKPRHLRLMIGSDAWDRGTKALQAKLDNLNDLKDIAFSTDYKE